MSDKSGIQWTEATWNPVTGCAKVSQGCKNCYALRDWARLSAPRPKPNAYTGRQFTDVMCHPERLAQPLRWTKPRRVFVNSMSDLFHESVPDEFIERVLTTTVHAKIHTFQILTKRPERMRSLMQRWTDMNGRPQSNLWLGVSVEDQETADERIPLLLQTPAAVRFVSYEPALGPVDFDSSRAEGFERHDGEWSLAHNYLTGFRATSPYSGTNGPKLDWVIVGGESGPKARPCDIAWIRSAVEQCKAAAVPVFVKQLGAKPKGWCCARLHGDDDVLEDGICDIDEAHEGPHCGDRCFALTDRKGGDMAEWPEDLRIREFPR